MNNGQINAAFLSSCSNLTQQLILRPIAAHYGISVDEIRSEVTDAEAENILEYMTGAERTATSVLFQQFISKNQ